MRHFITRQDLARLARQKKTMKSLQVQVFRNILHNEDVCNLAQHFSAKLCQIEKASECLLNGDQSSEKNEACRSWALFRQRHVTIWTQKKPFPHFPCPTGSPLSGTGGTLGRRCHWEQVSFLTLDDELYSAIKYQGQKGTMIMSGDNSAESMRLIPQAETNLQKYLGINMLAYCVDACLTQTRKDAV